MKYSFMKHYALIGYPLGHSFSKTYFEQKFATEKIEQCSFELFSIENIAEIKTILHNNINLQGLAVTIPHKQNIIPYLTNISNEANVIGAVNCIKVQDGKLIGYNTDVVGFENSLKPLLQKHHTRALVLGTGGASKAVQYVLQKLGINFLLVSRAKSNQQNTITYNDINESVIENNTIIINTTPVGMSPNDHEMPNLPYHLLTPKHLLYDLIYKPAKTQFLQKGQSQGCTTKNGFEMLQLQAEENWKIWNE